MCTLSSSAAPPSSAVHRASFPEPSERCLQSHSCCLWSVWCECYCYVKRGGCVCVWVCLPTRLWWRRRREKNAPNTTAQRCDVTCDVSFCPALRENAIALRCCALFGRLQVRCLWLSRTQVPLGCFLSRWLSLSSSRTHPHTRTRTNTHSIIVIIIIVTSLSLYPPRCNDDLTSSSGAASWFLV
jgi:hypothetical protein